MPRQKRQHLTRRKDGRYCCKYHGVQFMGDTEEEAFAKREAYKRSEIKKRNQRENPTVSELVHSWMTLYAAGASLRTYNSIAIHLEHLTQTIGGLLVKDVRPSDIKRVYAEHYTGLSDSYIKHADSLYRRLFASAVDDGIISTSPASQRTARPYKGSTGSHRSITPDERIAIETMAVDHPMHIAAIIMLYAGLRPQEVKALRMEDIDRQAGVIRVHSFVHMAKTNQYTETSTGKTSKAAREVPLFPPVEQATRDKHGLILSSDGGIASPTAWRRAWESYRNAIEREMNGMQKRWYGRTAEHKRIIASGSVLPPWKSFDVTPYDLRHSFASWCRDNGAEMHTVVDWMGHTDATMILRIYDAVSSERNQSEREKLLKTAFRMHRGMQEDFEQPENGSDAAST